MQFVFLDGLWARLAVVLPGSVGVPLFYGLFMSFSLGLKDAFDLSGILLNEAEALKEKVSVSIVDSSGQLSFFVRVPGASWSSIEISKLKAVTSVSFKSPTLVVAESIECESSRVQQQIYNRPDVILMGGGYPIYREGELIGAVGVSGATEDVDDRIARQGLQKFGNR